MGEPLILLSLLGLPLLDPETVLRLAAVSLGALGLALVGIGGWAWWSHRSEGRHSIPSGYRGHRRSSGSLTLRPGRAAELTSRADGESMRVLNGEPPAEQLPMERRIEEVWHG